MIATIVGELVLAAGALLSELPEIFNSVIGLVYSAGDDELTLLGTVIVATAGFALAWAGIRFVFSFVQRLLNKTRAGR